MSRLYCAVYGCLNSASSKPELSFLTLPGDVERDVVDQIRGPVSTKVFILIISGSDDEMGYSCSRDLIEVGDIVTIKFRFKRICGDESFEQHIVAWITSSKLKYWNDKVIKIAVTCKKMGYSEQWTCTETGFIFSDFNWKEMGIIHHKSRCQKVCTYVFEVDINVCVLESPLFKLYNDKDFTDFHLSSGEGSVAVHKACLASHSDVFKTMFGGKWKETVECRVEPEGVTLKTLQDFKDYLYLGSLPEQGLRPLLLLAMRYMIGSLKEECISSLVRKMKVTEELFDLLEFARENEIPELSLAVIQLIPISERMSHSLKQLQVGKN